MTRSLSVTTPSYCVVPASPVRPPGVLVTALRTAGQHVLVVVGEADMHTAGYLRIQLIDPLRSKPPSVLVELGGLKFCDLAGLDALHDAARAAHDAGVALTFRGMSAQLAWLHRTFPRSPVRPPSEPGLARKVDAPQEYLTGRDRSRRGASDGPVHAVPTSDRTRSAVCGARTWPATTSWTGTAPGTCPDCATAVSISGAVGTVHPFSASWPPAGIHPGSQDQPPVRLLSRGA